MFLRVLVVLAASTVGLGAGSLIYYAFIEDNMILRGSPRAEQLGNLSFGLAVSFFLATVYLLYLNHLSPLFVAAAGMMMTKFLWSCGDGYYYAARLYKVLTLINESSEEIITFLSQVESYRQIQDLRAVAQTMFAPDSHQMAHLDKLIEQVDSKYD